MAQNRKMNNLSLLMRFFEYRSPEERGRGGIVNRRGEECMSRSNGRILMDGGGKVGSVGFVWWVTPPGLLRCNRLIG